MVSTRPLLRRHRQLRIRPHRRECLQGRRRERRKERHPCCRRNSSILWSAGSLFIPILCWRRFSRRRPVSAEIPDAANWSNEHAGLTGDALANAIQQDNLPWDPSVLALLPFPQVLQMMAQDPGWTQALGDAVLAQRPDVMDAVQRMRQQAYSYGYLRPNAYDNVVNTGGYVEIQPVNPAFLYVPVYSPAVVFAAPRPGIVVGLSIHYAPSIFVGPAFVPFGWARPGFAWGTHAIIIGGSPWGRTWVNRTAYVHPYARAYRPAPGPRVEDHHAAIPPLGRTSPVGSGRNHFLPLPSRVGRARCWMDNAATQGSNILVDSVTVTFRLEPVKDFRRPIIPRSVFPWIHVLRSDCGSETWDSTVHVRSRGS